MFVYIFLTFISLLIVNMTIFIVCCEINNNDIISALFKLVALNFGVAVYGLSMLTYTGVGLDITVQVVK